MINLRYHVFSLVAVFAALAIGIVVGSTTVRSGLVDNLRGNVRRAEERIAEVEADNEELVTRSRQLDLLENDGIQLVSGVAPGVPVIWVTAPGVDDDVWAGVQRMARSAGTVTLGRVSLDADVADPETVEELALALGSTSTDADDLWSEFGSLVATRIDRALDVVEVVESTPGAPDDSVPDGRRPRRTTTTTSPPIGPEVELALASALGDLEDAGLLDLDEVVDGGVVEGAVAQVVVLDDLRSGIDSAPVLLSLVDELTGALERVVTLAEARPVRRSDDTPPSVVERVRDSGRLSDEMSTVDNLEDSPGWIATILAIRNASAGDLGHFGYRGDSDSLLPEPVP